MFSSFGENDLVQTVNSTILYRMPMVTETKMSHNTFISRLTFGRSLLDLLYASRQVNTIGRRSADYRAMVSRLENFLVDKVNR